MIEQIRYENVFKTIIEDAEGYIKRGRPRVEYMIQIMKDMNNEKYKDLK